MIGRIWRMLFPRPEPDATVDLAHEQERQLVDRLAAVSGKSAAEVRAEARRRALRLEVESMRRDR